MVKHNFSPYILLYTSPNENFENINPHFYTFKTCYFAPKVSLTSNLQSQVWPIKSDFDHDSVLQHILSQILTSSNQMLSYIRKCIVLTFTKLIFKILRQTLGLFDIKGDLICHKISCCFFHQSSASSSSWHSGK